MRFDEPRWWYCDTPSVAPHLLAPLAAVWGRTAQRRYVRAAHLRPDLPVICIGNLTAGGTGKTPLALHVAAMLGRLGRRPAVLTRGYRGRIAGPHWVAAGRDSASDVGDEPLLLGRVAPTLVSRDRAAGALAIVGSGAGIDVIVMDDGLQNGGIAKDLTLAVVDGRRGFGNGHVIPAGPLRAPLEFQLSLVDAVVVNTPEGSEPAGVGQFLRDRFPGPVLTATTRPAGDTSWLKGEKVLAFSGIGAPERFFALVERSGAQIVERIAFPDHHSFAEADARGLLTRATAQAARLITTEKDWVRLRETGASGRLKQVSRTLPIRLDLGARDALRLEGLVAASLARRSDRTA
ncbi:MAG: tetraacyldisaccharide 4'-kinase [Hyphomicrobiaceae bacterium]|nr:tetraacyldisaccharide 4'-kinase [Hyphomicrobiaceae bacterium]